MKKFLKILMWMVLGFVIIQLIPVDRTNPPIDEKQNFITINNTPPKIKSLLQNACYDCHSFETKYPNYAYVAPISWSIKHHINEGRDHANFSIWGKYNTDLKKNILQKAIDEVNGKRMPIPGYMVYHKESQLTDTDRKLLSNYFQQVLDSGKF